MRTPEECLEVHEQNIELNISLLDQRFLAGDRALYADSGRQAAALPARQPRRADAQSGAAHARAPRANIANTFYHLEPNVKETPGGLRDYQLVCWLEPVREPSSASPDRPELRQASCFLARLRCFLHCQAGRDRTC